MLAWIGHYLELLGRVQHYGNTDVPGMAAGACLEL